MGCLSSYKNYLKISLPVVLNETIWSLGINCYSMIYARMSTEAVATVNVVSSIERIVFVGFIGLANTLCHLSIIRMCQKLSS